MVNQYGVTDLIHDEAQAFLRTTVFEPSVQMFTLSKRQITAQCYYENRFYLAGLLGKNCRDPSGSMEQIWGNDVW